MGKMLNYEELIRGLNNDAFEYCKKMLLPICYFAVLESEDIRPCDLAERVIQLSDKYHYATYKSGDEWKYYLETMRKYIVFFLDCSQGSRAERYRNRLIDLINLCEKTGDLSEIESIIMIFVSLFREREKDIALMRSKNKSESKSEITVFIYNMTDRLLNDAEFAVMPSDGNLLKTIIEDTWFIPDELKYEKRVGLKREIPRPKQISIRSHFYLVSSILLCMALQSAGVFLK